MAERNVRQLSYSSSGCFMEKSWRPAKQRQRRNMVGGQISRTIKRLATKGRMERQSASVRELVVSHRREHSRKPDEVRDRIVELVGDLPRIELFARQRVDGWDAWGNEV